MSADRLEQFLKHAEGLVSRLETLLPGPPQLPDFSAAVAFRWRRVAGPFGQRGLLQPVAQVHSIRLADLHDVDDQKARIDANTRQFLAGKPANNVLLTGARGCGKSSLVKALINEYGRRGLRMIEVDKNELVDLPDVIDLVSGRKERFIVFCDDLSFEAGDATYKALKVVLDGSLAAAPDNLLIYATSNRRHLMPEFFSENLETRHVDGEIHPGETTEEKISLSERFGLWLSFYPFSQDEYLDIVRYWLGHFGCDAKAIEGAERDALNWSLGRGSRSGRVAWQFAKDWAGTHTARKSRKS